jgi:hypothetical protein
MSILSAYGMANETKRAVEVYEALGYYGLLSWRTRDIEKMYDWMLTDKQYAEFL